PRRSSPPSRRSPSRCPRGPLGPDRKSTRLNSSHVKISYAVFCLKKKKTIIQINDAQRKTRIRKISYTEKQVASVINASVTVSDSDSATLSSAIVFFFNDTATTEIYTLSLHDALPISRCCQRFSSRRSGVRSACSARKS